MSLKARLAAGETLYGVWGALDSTFAAELIAAERPDFYCCDQQHGAIELPALLALTQALRAGGTLPISRVTSHDPMLIGRTLDAGVLGVIVPMIESPEQAARVVASFAYQPDGVRSFGPTLAGLVHGSIEPRALSDVACILMIETAAALEHVDEIAAVGGVDALYVGPADLRLSLGLPPLGPGDEPIFDAALTRVLGACERHGIAPGIHCFDGTTARRCAERGFRLINAASDTGALRAGVRAELAAARA